MLCEARPCSAKHELEARASSVYAKRVLCAGRHHGLEPTVCGRPPPEHYLLVVGSRASAARGPTSGGSLCSERLRQRHAGCARAQETCRSTAVLTNGHGAWCCPRKRSVVGGAHAAAAATAHDPALAGGSEHVRLRDLCVEENAVLMRNICYIAFLHCDHCARPPANAIDKR